MKNKKPITVEELKKIKGRIDKRCLNSDELRKFKIYQLQEGKMIEVSSGEDDYGDPLPDIFVEYEAFDETTYTVWSFEDMMTCIDEIVNGKQTNDDFCTMIEKLEQKQWPWDSALDRVIENLEEMKALSEKYKR